MRVLVFYVPLLHVASFLYTLVAYSLNSREHSKTSHCIPWRSSSYRYIDARRKGRLDLAVDEHSPNRNPCWCAVCRGRNTELRPRNLHNHEPLRPFSLTASWHKIPFFPRTFEDFFTRFLKGSRRLIRRSQSALLIGGPFSSWQLQLLHALRPFSLRTVRTKFTLTAPFVDYEFLESGFKLVQPHFVGAELG